MRVSRKWISDMLTAALGQEVSVDMVRKNGPAWGIEVPSIRMELNKRVVTYDRSKLIAALRRAKVLDRSAATAASSFR